MNADLAFQNAANAAAAYAATPPAYVSYISRTHISIPSLQRERNVECSEVTRTSDGTTFVVDLPRGRNRVEAFAFPLPPTFNAVSAFDLRYGMSWHGNATFRVSNVRPQRFNTAAPSDADVVVFSTYGYHIKYAPDSSDDAHSTTHLILTQTARAMRESRRDQYHFSEMRIDNASNLPVEVMYVGNDDFRMIFRYGFESGRWAITSAHLESTLKAPLNIGRVHFIADTVFNNTAFSAQSPIPQL